MQDYQKHFSTKQTPQSRPIPGTDQKQNNAGGYAWEIDNWQVLDRFLILGTTGGTYYVNERDLTVRNADAIAALIKENGARVVNRVVEISDQGRAASNDPALFVLAMCAGMGDEHTRKTALAELPRVARIGTHLFHFLEYVKAFRGWGRALRDAVANWYNSRSPDSLAYQVIKYRRRDGWTHTDALRLSHTKPATPSHNAIFRWVTKGELTGEAPSIIDAFERAQRAQSEKELIDLISDYKLPWEAIPTQFLKSPALWEAMLPSMPMTALIRNLGRMSSIGLLLPMSDASRTVVEKLSSIDAIRNSRVHPLKVLVALVTYRSGRGARGSLSWDAVPQVTDALDEAFYMSFGNVEPTGRRVLLALDVSTSMFGSIIMNMPGMTPAVASAAMAMVTARVEPNYHIMGFSHQFVPLDISKSERLDSVVDKINKVPFGATDCALPMIWAMGYQRDRLDRYAKYVQTRRTIIDTDAFVIYTDNETWFGDVHPSQALADYRRRSGIDAKLVVVGMVANKFSIADPNDHGMLDVVGFDTNTPQVISEFIGY